MYMDLLDAIMLELQDIKALASLVHKITDNGGKMNVSQLNALANSIISSSENIEELLKKETRSRKGTH